MVNVENPKGHFIHYKEKKGVPVGLDESSKRSRLAYLTELNKTKYLTEEETNALLDDIQKGYREDASKEDMDLANDAENAIIVSFQPLIFTMASKYATTGNQMDYVNEAVIAVKKSLSKYDPTKSSLRTYLITVIANHFSNIFNENLGIIDMPVHHYKMKKLRSIIQKFRAENEREPTEEEIADMCEENGLDTYTPHTIDGYKYVQFGYGDVNDEDTHGALQNRIARECASESLAESSLAKEDIRRIIPYYLKCHEVKLSPKDRELFKRDVNVIYDLYGWNENKHEFSRYEASVKYNVSEERIRQIERDMLELMRKIVPRSICA